MVYTAVGYNYGIDITSSQINIIHYDTAYNTTVLKFDTIEHQVIYRLRHCEAMECEAFIFFLTKLFISVLKRYYKKGTHLQLRPTR